MPHPIPVPPASFLDAYAQKNAFTDCYAISVPGTASLPDLIEAFYTTRLFKLERWLLSKALSIPSTDVDASLLARTATQRFCAWKVEHRSDSEILLDAGQTRSWLSVRPQAGSASNTTLLFGSAVLPMRPGGKFGLVFHALIGFHRLYSKLLLAAAARRVVALRKTPPIPEASRARSE